MSSISPYHNLIACLRCDNLCKYQNLEAGQKAICPTCGSVLLARKSNCIDRTFTIALAGLLLFIPAMFLPIITISAAGHENSASLFDCIGILIEHEFPISALFVLMFALALPLIKLISATYLSYCLKYERVTPSLVIFFRSYRALEHWVMLHVFFLGIVVSLYKLVSLASISVGVGLVSFALLLLCSTLISVTVDEQFIWEKMEQLIVR